MAMILRSLSDGGLVHARLLVVVLAAASGTLSGQALIPGGGFRLFTSDAAILESQEVRKDIPCSVTPVKPVLGFDLKFHSGYEVSIPLRELAGDGNQLTMIFRVVPEKSPDEPVFLSQRMSVPVIDDDARGDAYLQGAFEVGEGKYHVDWLMRDRSEHVCSANWEVEASLPAKDKDMALDIPPATVHPSDNEPFKEEPPVARVERDTPLNVKVIVNFAPQNALSATLQPLDTNALVSILRNIAREPRIGKFSIVAFNMQEQRVLYRQESAAQIDFPALGDALHSLNLGTVDMKRLAQKHGDTEFLTNLMASEIKDGDAIEAAIRYLIARFAVQIRSQIRQGGRYGCRHRRRQAIVPRSSSWRTPGKRSSIDRATTGRHRQTAAGADLLPRTTLPGKAPVGSPSR